MEFTEFELGENLRKGIDAIGFKETLPVQEKSFEHTLGGRDVFVQSQTGTGKTAAFLISIFQNFLNNPEKNNRALIIAPTRELVVQIEKEAKDIGKYLDYQIGSFYGGVGYTNQEKMLKDKVSILIGTPGRLIDFHQQRKLNLKEIDILVIDEADRLFDMGFLQDIKIMLKGMVPASQRMTMLYSATLNNRVRTIAWEYMEDPAEIEIDPEQVTVDKIDQVLYHVGVSEKMKLLLGIIKEMNPLNAIIFTNTKRNAYEVANRLKVNGIKCEYLIGDMPQSKRLRVIEKVKEGKIPFLVATDVAARGLHINDLELVVNYDIPLESENYVHRIGRTARVGKSGKAVSFACENFVYGLEAIESYTGIKIPVVWADDYMFVEDQSRGMSFRLDRDGNQGGRKVNRNRDHVRKAVRKDYSSKKSTTNKTAGHSKRSEENKRTNQQNRNEQNKRNSFHDNNRNDFKNKDRVDLKAPDSGASLEERVNYYKAKYGDDFKVTDKMIQEDRAANKSKKKNKSVKANNQNKSNNKKESGSLIGKITGIFKKKK